MFIRREGDARLVQRPGHLAVWAFVVAVFASISYAVMAMFLLVAGFAGNELCESTRLGEPNGNYEDRWFPAGSICQYPDGSEHPINGWPLRYFVDSLSIAAVLGSLACLVLTVISIKRLRTDWPEGA